MVAVPEENPPSPPATRGGQWADRVREWAVDTRLRHAVHEYLEHSRLIDL
jgi:hypothetical protein